MSGAVINDRRRQANQQNSRLSTGPRTTAGKAVSAQNAGRHGLRAPVMSDATLSADVVAFANEIAGADAGVKRRELALRVAEAHVDLMRVRQARVDLIARAKSDPRYQVPSGSPSGTDTTEDTAGGLDFVHMIAGLEPRLATLNQYERRAWSRRKQAMREFDDLVF